MQVSVTCRIESIAFEELLNYMRFQADDVFPSLKEEKMILAFANKLHINAEFCASRKNGKLVGMIAFYANGQGADFAYIPHVYVSPEYRKNGLFSRMLNKVEEYVKGKGFYEIRLEVEKDNKSALTAYLNNGFLYGDNARFNSVYMVKGL